mmetsp:Transcript_96784/g.295871  ORF Transcript_96784/g.295871 Transcript_96784/m.295871 type:complete len:202 (+) Transcript_96784:610-1215(+)
MRVQTRDNVSHTVSDFPALFLTTVYASMTMPKTMFSMSSTMTTMKLQVQTREVQNDSSESFGQSYSPSTSSLKHIGIASGSVANSSIRRPKMKCPLIANATNVGSSTRRKWMMSRKLASSVRMTTPRCGCAWNAVKKDNTKIKWYCATNMRNQPLKAVAPRQLSSNRVPGEFMSAGTSLRCASMTSRRSSTTARRRLSCTR